MRRQLPPAGLPQLQGTLDCVARIVTKRLSDLSCNQPCVGTNPHYERGSPVALPRGDRQSKALGWATGRGSAGMIPRHPTHQECRPTRCHPGSQVPRSRLLLQLNRRRRNLPAVRSRDVARGRMSTPTLLRSLKSRWRLGNGSALRMNLPTGELLSAFKRPSTLSHFQILRPSKVSG